MKSILEITNLKANIGKKKILYGINLSIKMGEIHVLMGPNGSGKSTFANILMGNPQYTQTAGKINLNNIDITSAKPEIRACNGLFLAFQTPCEIKGIQLDNFLFTAYKALFNNKIKHGLSKEKPKSIFAFKKELEKQAVLLKFNKKLLARDINCDFSGGEKKKAELLQLAIFNPQVAILDEIDSGLDIDSLKITGKTINNFVHNKKSVIVITHSQRLLKYLNDYIVHIMLNGKIIKSGGKELATKLEKNGYEQFIQ